MTNWTWLTFKALKSMEVSNNCLHYSIKIGWSMGVKIMKSHVEMSSLSNSQKSFNKFIISQFKSIVDYCLQKENSKKWFLPSCNFVFHLSKVKVQTKKFKIMKWHVEMGSLSKSPKMVDNWIKIGHLPIDPP